MKNALFSLFLRSRASLLPCFSCFLILSVFVFCSNDSDDDILTAEYEFTNSCDNTSENTCTNYYPEDGEHFSCDSSSVSSDMKCDDTDVIGLCSKIPRTWEIVYYNMYTEMAMENCNLIGQTRFSTDYVK